MNARTHHRPGRISFSAAVFVFAAANLAWLGGPVAAEGPDLPPAWHCLPPQTTAAIRIPNGKAFADALRNQTKLGAVMFSDDRIERFKTMIMEQDPKQWESFKSNLAKYGLGPNDFPALLAGESGFAVLIDSMQGGQRIDASAATIGLSWLEPGEELAQRVIEAIGKAVADQEDDEQGPRRVDIEINDRPVMQLSLPVVSVTSGAVDFQWPEDFGQMPEDQRQQVIQRQQKQQEAGEVSVKYNHLLLTRMGGRLLSANTFQPSDDRTIDPTRLTTAFARFLAAHDGGEGGFAERIESTDGVKQSLPQSGVGMFEMFADVSSLIRLGDADPNAARAIKALGVDALNVVALRATLDGTLMRMGMFLAAPEPRTGILALLDQPLLAPKPPAWVPSSIVGYSHTSADLGKMYTQIKQMILGEFGQEAQMPIQMAEGLVTSAAQADLATVLSSIGHKHMVLTFEPEPDGDQDEDAPPGPQMQKIAIVWNTKQEDLLSRLFTALGAMAGNNAITATEEQGFNGWRFRDGGHEGGLMLGKGHMILAIGRGVLERTLSHLNEPLEGPDAMVTGEVYARAREMMPLAPGLRFQIADGSRYSRMLKQMIEGALTQAERAARRGNAGGDAVRWIASLRNLLPDEDEMEGVMGAGASVSTLHVDELGLVMKGGNDLPAP